MKRKTFAVSTIALSSLLIALLSLSIVAAETVTVYIYKINQPETWKGKMFTMGHDTYWAGEIHIQYGGKPPSGTHTRAYCLEYDAILYTDRTYTYTIADVQDNSQWKSISYILSWYDPPTNNNEAAAIQGAIWKTLKGYDPSGYGNSLALEAQNKDVIRKTDKLLWTSPISVVGPGEKITLTINVTDKNGNGRPNVRIKFATTEGTLNKLEAFTDTNGEANVTLTAPSEMGISIEVTAWSKGVWPNKYICTSATQDLLGIGDDLGLTATTEIHVFARLNVIPDVPLGTITAVAACFLAFIAKTKKLRFHTKS